MPSSGTGARSRVASNAPDRRYAPPAARRVPPADRASGNAKNSGGDLADNSAAGNAGKRLAAFSRRARGRRGKTHAFDHVGAALPEQLASTRDPPACRPAPASAVATITPPSSNSVSASCTGPRLRAPARALALKRAVMPRIQRRLGARKRQPHQRVEHVVPVARAHLHLAAQENARLVAVFERVCRGACATKRSGRPAAFSSGSRRAASTRLKSSQPGQPPCSAIRAPPPATAQTPASVAQNRDPRLSS